MGGDARPRAGRDPPPRLRPAAGAQGGVRAAHDDRDGQAARRGARRGRLRRRVPALVQRGDRAHPGALRREPRGHRPHDRVAAPGRARASSSRRGTSRSRWRPARSRPRSPPAAPSSSSRPSSPRSRRSHFAKLLEDAGLPKGVVNVFTDLDVGRRLRADHPRPAAAQALVHRARRRSGSGCSSRPRRACCAPRWSSAATRRSSSSTTPTSTRPSTARCWRSSATSARPAPPRTASSCTARSPTSSPAASPSACRR